MSGSRNPLTPYGSLRSNSSSFATVAAIRRAPSRVSSLAAHRRPGSSWKYSFCPLSFTMKQASLSSSTGQGGGKRRGNPPTNFSLGRMYAGRAFYFVGVYIRARSSQLRAIWPMTI
jgi:hypothetical protein